MRCTRHRAYVTRNSGQADGGPRGCAASTTSEGGAVGGGSTTADPTTTTRGGGSAGWVMSANAGADSDTQSGQSGHSAGLCGTAGAWSGVSSAWQMTVTSAKAAASGTGSTEAPEANCARSASSVKIRPGWDMRRWLMTRCHHTERRQPHNSRPLRRSNWSLARNDARSRPGGSHIEVRPRDRPAGRASQTAPAAIDDRLGGRSRRCWAVTSHLIRRLVRHHQSHPQLATRSPAL